MPHNQKPDNEPTNPLEAYGVNAADAILTMDHRGTVKTANPATEALFGYSTSEIVGQNITQLVPSLCHEEHDNYLVDSPSIGETKIMGSGPDVVGRRKDGSTFPMFLAVSEAHANGEQCYRGIVRDISQFKEREAQLQGILDSAVDAIITISEKGVVLEVNPATVRMFGYTASEVIGQNVTMLMPSPFIEEHDGFLANYVATGNKKIIGIGREVDAKRKNGSTFPVHLAVSEVQVGQQRTFTGIVRDISDLKEADRRRELLNQELEHRERSRTSELRATQAELVKNEKLATLGQVSGGIAHEIRNPLNAVKTSAFYLLKAKDPPANKIQEHLERIDRQVTIIDNVVTALSDVARLPNPVLRPHAIAGIIEASLQSVSLPENIETEICAAKSLPEVMIDEHQIPMVFKNLIRNARDAMPDGGKITIQISADAEKSLVQIDVIDTGIGIVPEDLLRITEPLYSTKARGMGLGLAISVAILKKNSGSLIIESEFGVGSCFRITLMASPSH